MTTHDDLQAAIMHKAAITTEPASGRCCTAPECCGPGSWCCARAGEHSHEEVTR